MTREQYLEVLGLDTNASWEDVVFSYRTLCKVWHPDRFVDDEAVRVVAEAQMKELNEAFAFLERDPVVRARVDSPPDNQDMFARSESSDRPDFDRREERSDEPFEAVPADLSELFPEPKTLVANVLCTILLSLVILHWLFSDPVGATSSGTSAVPVDASQLAQTTEPAAPPAAREEPGPPRFYRLKPLPAWPVVREEAPTVTLEREPSPELIKEVIEQETETSLFEMLPQRAYKERDKLYRLSGETDVEESYKGYTPDLIDAAISCDKKAVETMLADGVEVDLIDSVGDTALIWSVRRRCAPVAKLLIKAGADVNARSRNGFSPYVWARLYKTDDIRLLLEQAGADVRYGLYWWRYEHDTEQQWIEKALANLCRNRDCTIER